MKLYNVATLAIVVTEFTTSTTTTTSSCRTTGGYAFEGTACASSCQPYQNPTLPYTSTKRPPIQPVHGSGTTWCSTVAGKLSKSTRKKWGFCNCDSSTGGGSSTPSPNSMNCGPHSNQYVCTYVIGAEGCRTASSLRGYTFDSASQVCQGSGGRLCTENELTSGLAKSLCPVAADDSRPVWTKSTCTSTPSSSSGRKSQKATATPTIMYLTMAGDGSGSSACEDPLTAKMRSLRCCKDLTTPLRNVLLITLDDMRADTFAAYGRLRPRMPNLDSFTRSRGTVVFEKAYCQFPICSPSRSSFLMGMSPDSTGVYGDAQTIPMQWTSMPKFFKTNGYVVTGGGKVFHPGQDYVDENWVDYYFPNTNPYQWPDGCAISTANKFTTPSGIPVVSGQICKMTDPDTSGLIDFQLAAKAQKTLERLVRYQQPFFMAVGFFLPHLPYVVASQYWESNILSAADDAEHPAGPTPQSSFDPALTLDPAASLADGGGNETPWLWQSLDPDWRKIVRAGYYAAMAQVDACVGQVLTHLSDLGLADTTMVIIMGDHGFSVGENGFWNKNVLMELATRTSVVMRVPWLMDNKKEGTVVRTHRIVELLDIYRTVAGVMGIGHLVPSNVQGQDRSQLISDTIAGNTNAVADASSMAFSQVVRCGLKVDCYPFGTNYDGIPTNATVPKLPPIVAVGYSVRTQQWRYTAFFACNGMKYVQWSTVIHQELFSHQEDSQNLFDYTAPGGVSFAQETENVAAQNPDICASLLPVILTRFAPPPTTPSLR